MVTTTFWHIIGWAMLLWSLLIWASTVYLFLKMTPVERKFAELAGSAYIVMIAFPIIGVAMLVGIK
jgi:hypothetical protein